jgi:hypothetical protein
LPDANYPNLGKKFRASDWKMMKYFMAIWNILRTFGLFYAHLEQIVSIWYFFPVLVSFTMKNLATLLGTDVIIGICGNLDHF